MTRYELRLALNTWCCGCGSPAAAARFLYDVLNTIATRWKTADYDAYQVAKKQIFPNDGIEYFVLYVLTHWDLLEHGGGVGGSWLTDKGKAMLEALARETADDFHRLCEPSCLHGYAVGTDEICPSGECHW